MKIYNRIVLSASTGELIEEDSYEYDGPVAECKGGGSTTTNTQDPEFNARMAAISEENNTWAREMYNTFKYGTTYDPTEVITNADGTTTTKGAQMGYNAADYTSEMSLMQKNIEAAFGLVDEQTALERQNIATQQAGLGLQSAQYDAAGKLLPQQTALEQQSLGLQSQKMTAEGSLIDSATEVARKGLGLQSQQIDANSSLLPLQTESTRQELGLYGEQMSAASGLLPQQTATTRSKLEAEALTAQDRMKSIRERSPLVSSFYDQAMTGVNVNQRVSEAQSSVEQGFASATDSGMRDLSRYGINPNSGRGLAAMRNVGLAKATALAGASTGAANTAEAENFDRKRSALGIGI